MNESSSGLHDIWMLLLSSSIPIVVILGYLFKHPDKFEHWMAIFYRILFCITSNLPRLKNTFDRHAVASSIQDAVNTVGEQIEKQVVGILPHALKVEWVDDDTPESFIRKGRVVVRLRHYSNQDKNIVDSTLLYLKTALLPRARNYIDASLRVSTEFKIATRVFLSKRDTGAYDYFVEHELQPSIATEPKIGVDLQILEHVDSGGFFIHGFLSEVKQTGERLLGAAPTQAIQQELRDFALFLETIATKGWDERVPLSFDGAKIRASVVLVAKKETIQLYGIEPYVNRVRLSVNKGYDSIYITGWGEEFVGKVLQIRDEINRKYVNVLRRYDFFPRANVKGLLLVCQSNSSHLARQRELEQEVIAAFTDLVPEIKNKDIEIVGIARIKGVGSKIAVRSLSGLDESVLVGTCIGSNAERVNMLKAKIGDSFVGIVPWSDDSKDFVTNSLRPLRESLIRSIVIDYDQFIANVTVETDDAVAKAIGKDGTNVKLASQLTGYLINIEGPRSLSKSITPEEELRVSLTKNVLEIQNGEIEIVRIARIRGLGSRVILKWKNPRGHILAAQACRGHSDSNIRNIQSEIPGERLYFHEWFEDTRELLLNCLYPLKRSDIRSIDLRDKDNMAIISKQPDAQMPDKYSLALTERVTGWRIEFANEIKQ